MYALHSLNHGSTGKNHSFIWIPSPWVGLAILMVPSKCYMAINFSVLLVIRLSKGTKTNGQISLAIPALGQDKNFVFSVRDIPVRYEHQCAKTTHALQILLTIPVRG